MRYRVLKLWYELGKDLGVFLTNRMEESLHPFAKNCLIRLSTRKKFDASRISPLPNFYPPHYITSSVL